MVEAVKSQVMEPRQAQFEMLLQGDVVTDSIMAEAVRKQTLELESLRAGRQAQVVASEDHETSIKVIEKFTSSAGFLMLDPEQQNAIQEHWAAHRAAMLQLAGIEGQFMQPEAGRPGTPSAPAGANPTFDMGSAGPL